MYLASRWLFRNLSRLELVAAWIVILVLIGVFARYMFVVFARAEQTMIERSVTNINTALKYTAGLAGMQGKYGIIKQLAEGNPMLLGSRYESELPFGELPVQDEPHLSLPPALSVPSGYGGTVTGSELDGLERGRWYYDEAEGLLIYLVRNTEFFVSELEGVPRIRYEVRLDYTDRNGNGEYDPGMDDYHSIRLESRDVFRWVH